MGFANSIAAWEKKALAAMDKGVSNSAEDLFTQVVVNSPEPPGKGGYSTGLLKNQWYTGVNGDVSHMLTTATSPIGADSLSRIKSSLSRKIFLGKDSSITLSNNVPYVRYVEYIGWPKDYPGNDTGWDWTGKIGPYGMVNNSVIVWKAKYL